jgi:hypothetical protein
MALAPFFDKSALAAAGLLPGVDSKNFAERLEKECVGLAWGDDAATSPEGRIALELTVNLLARLYPRVALVSAGERAAALEPTLSALARSINPDIELASQDVVRTQTIAVGADAPAKVGAALFLGSDGWVFRLSRTHPLNCGTSGHPFGAAVAACLAAANVFRAVFADVLNGGDLDTEVDASVLGLDPVSRAPLNPPLVKRDLGQIVLMGAGAVGQGAVWALVRTPVLAGNLQVVDPELLELSNVQRYVLAGMADIDRAKVAIAESAIAEQPTSGLTCVPVHARWGEFLAKRPVPWTIERLLVAVDSAEDRIAAQASLPRKLHNAWTQAGDLGISLHEVLGTQACLACLYLPTEPRKSLDLLVAESIGLPQDLMAIRQLLATGEAIGPAMVQRIADARGVPSDELMPFAGKSMRAFYVEAVCGGIMLRLGGDKAAAPTEVPMAFQSALAGVLLAASIFTADVAPDAFPIGSKVVWDPLHRFRGAGTVPLAKPTVRKCICQDSDFVAVAHSRWGGSSRP